jgi:hypothetical protein
MQNKKPAVKMTTGLRQSEKWAHETQGWCISASNAVVLTALSVLYASIIPWPHRIIDFFRFLFLMAAEPAVFHSDQK